MSVSRVLDNKVQQRARSVQLLHQFCYLLRVSEAVSSGSSGKILWIYSGGQPARSFGGPELPTSERQQRLTTKNARYSVYK